MNEENVRNQNVSVGTTSALIAPLVHQGQRRLISIVNTSTAGEIVTISVDKTAVANAGIVLTAFGSSWSESVDSGFNPSNKEYYAIASAATATIAIHERIKA